ncbi:MAG: hypothetical protein RMK79_07585, partial [Anaerolineae bacterium]|nr:hypothetical protein [Anaerolineae bacterium]
LIASKIADAAIEGLRLRETMAAELEEEGLAVAEEGQERYLGPSTLAKLRATARVEVEEEEWEEFEEELEEEEDTLRARATYVRRRASEKVSASPATGRIFEPDDEADEDEYEEEEEDED